MKNKKGFTLIEIIVIILLISIFFMIAVPSVMKVRSSIKTRELEAKKEALVAAAELYAKNNTSLFGDSTYIQIPVRTLVYYGYLNKDLSNNSKNCNEQIGCVINPVNDESMNDELITIKRIKSVIKVTYGDEPEPNTVWATFDANGATLKGVASTSLKLGCEVYANDTCRISVPTIEREGFEIDGWNKSKKAKTGEVLNVIEFSENVTYYAITHKTITGTFYSNTDSSTNEKETRTCDIFNTSTSCKIIDTPTFIRDEYTFKGWYTAASGGKTMSFTKLSKDFKAYAQWDYVLRNVYYKWDGKLVHTVEGRDCPQRCILECQNIPNRFTYKDVTYDLKCMSDGDYSEAEKEYMHTFISGFMWHKIYGSYNPYNCTRVCYDNPNNYGTCTYFTIQFGSVSQVYYQNSCVIE